MAVIETHRYHILKGPLVWKKQQNSTQEKEPDNARHHISPIWNIVKHKWKPKDLKGWGEKLETEGGFIICREEHIDIAFLASK